MMKNNIVLSFESLSELPQRPPKLLNPLPENKNKNTRMKKRIELSPEKILLKLLKLFILLPLLKVYSLYHML